MPTLILTRGIPGSGKSTWAKEQVSTNPNLVRVNRDNLRFELYGKYWGLSKKQEGQVTRTQHERARAALDAGKDVVIDDTNVNPAIVSGWHRMARSYGGKVQLSFKDFEVDAQECIRRDKQRMAEGKRGVGEEVIKDFVTRAYGKDGKLRKVPYYMRKPIPVLPKPEDRPNAVIFDMDGTLTDVRTVRHHVRGEGGKRDFHAFHTESEFCPPNIHVLEMAKDAHANGLSVVIVTARDEKYRALTERWLSKNGVEYAELYTRGYNDSRPDYEAKKEIFDELSGYYRVVHAVDDNPNVLRLWREHGIAVTEVAGFDDPLDPTTSYYPPIPINSPIKGGRCLRCNRKMKRDGVLGPECAKEI